MLARGNDRGRDIDHGCVAVAGARGAPVVGGDLVGRAHRLVSGDVGGDVRGVGAACVASALAACLHRGCRTGSCVGGIQRVVGQWRVVALGNRMHDSAARRRRPSASGAFAGSWCDDDEDDDRPVDSAARRVFERRQLWTGSMCRCRWAVRARRKHLSESRAAGLQPGSESGRRLLLPLLPPGHPGERRRHGLRVTAPGFVPSTARGFLLALVALGTGGAIAASPLDPSRDPRDDTWVTPERSPKDCAWYRTADPRRWSAKEKAAAEKDCHVEEEWRAFVTARQSCSTDQDCALVATDCPFGCMNVPVAAVHAKAVTKKESELRKRLVRVCNYKCPPVTRTVCRERWCVGAW